MGNLSSHLPTVKVNSYEEIGDEVTTTTTTPISEQTPAPETPGGTLPKSLMELIDPRSPTMGVSRTPVEVVAERERTRLERARKLRSLDALTIADPVVSEKGDELTVPATTPTDFGFDPRSPTFDYNRTPLALGSDNINKQVGDASPMEIPDDTPGKKVYDNELSVPSNSSQMSRDLRKRLFAAQFSDPVTEAEECNKEN